MSLSTEQLREDFKAHLDKWEGTLQHTIDPSLKNEIQQWAEQVERYIEKKIQLLEMDFNEYPLRGEYLRSVSEGFDDLEQLMRNHKTLMDLTHHEDVEVVLKHIRHYYKQYVIPLLNIMSKLENDYIAIITSAILKSEKIIHNIDLDLSALENEKDNIQHDFFSFNRKNKFLTISKKIKLLKIKKKIARLTLHHDKLNLYYFNHNRPPELKEIKEKRDKLLEELETFKKMLIDD